MFWRWIWPPARREARLAPEPLHVRVFVLREKDEDMTVEGWQTGAQDGWLMLDRAVILHGDGRRTAITGHYDIPLHRVLGRVRLVSIALPELPELVGAGAEA
jgi:hypothetical protein